MKCNFNVEIQGGEKNNFPYGIWMKNWNKKFAVHRNGWECARKKSKKTFVHSGENLSSIVRDNVVFYFNSPLEGEKMNNRSIISTMYTSTETLTKNLICIMLLLLFWINCNKSAWSNAIFCFVFFSRFAFWFQYGCCFLCPAHLLSSFCF